LLLCAPPERFITKWLSNQVTSDQLPVTKWPAVSCGVCTLIKAYHKMTKWPCDQVTKWPSDQVTKWPSDQVTKWSSDQWKRWWTISSKLQFLIENSNWRRSKARRVQLVIYKTITEKKICLLSVFSTNNQTKEIQH
jgi:hypothetical protein